MMKHQPCQNCGHKTTSNYCRNCGQQNDVARLRWASLAESFVSSFVGDGAIGEKRTNVRYGFLLTIWSILTRPGQTIEEFLEGRRRKYFNPVTILLLLSGFYALIGVFTGVIDDTPKPSNDLLGQYFNLIRSYYSSRPAMIYLSLLPFSALAYKWIFRKRSDLYYVEYMYVGIFSAIFSVLLLFVELPLKSELLADGSTYATAATFAAQCWFSVAVYRRLFRTGFMQSIWSWIKVITISYTLLFITLTIALGVMLWAYWAIDPNGFTETFAFLNSTSK